MKSSHFFLLAAAVCTFSWAPVVTAAVYDLNGVGTVVVPNPAGNLVISANFIKAGTGIFDPFLTIQASGTEQGFNSVTQPLDTKRAPVDTHELTKLQLVTSTTQTGVEYYSFLLDVNESNNPLTSFITVDALKIYTSPTMLGTLSELETSGTLRFNLDANEDNTLVYNDANSGSGEGDIAFFVPVSAFVGVPDNYFVYIYQQFGATAVAGPPAGSNGGFEETSLAADLIIVPEVGSLVPLMAVLGAVFAGPFVRRRFGKLSPQTT
jgi:hypothetical protein